VTLTRSTNLRLGGVKFSLIHRACLECRYSPDDIPHTLHRTGGPHLSKAGWSWGCVSAIDSKGRTMWIVDAHRDNGKRLVVHADGKVTACLELASAIRACGDSQ
jgi:hypothetical protein